jgi:hypothetical protein
MTLTLVRIRRSWLAGVACVLGALAVVAPAAHAAGDTTHCVSPALSQPFLDLKDANWYTLAPGQSVDNFGGEGWTLSGGASVVTTTLADGTTAQVLDLPSGSKAVSPDMCITQDYPTARSMVRNVKGFEGISFYVSHFGRNSWDSPKSAGSFKGQGSAWTASNSLNIQPGNDPGWSVAHFTFEAGGKKSDFQMYNFYVDPRLRH